MLNEETLTQKFIKKWFWLYIFTFLWAPISYIIKIILSHDISVEDVGLFYGIISLITLLSAINDLGGTESLNYFLPKYIIQKDFSRVKYLLSLAFKWQISSSIIIIFLLFFWADWLGQNYFKHSEASKILKIFLLFFLGTNISQICVVLFSATQNTKLQKSIDFIRLIFSVIFVILIFKTNNWNILNYTISWILGLFLSVGFALFFAYKNYYLPYLKNTPKIIDKNLRKEFIKYAIPTFIVANISLILSQIDAQLIIWMLGNEAHGFYSNYLSIMTIPFIFLSPIIAFLFPVFTELYTRKNFEKIKLLYRIMLTVLVILSFWISIFLFFNGKSLTVLLFGQNYEYSGYILQFSVLFLIFNIISQLNFQLLAWTGRARDRVIAFGITLPINIILNIILIKIFNWPEGSALAVGISWIPLILTTFYFVREYITMPNFKPIILNFLAIIFIVFIQIFYKNFFENLNNLNYFIIQIIIFAIIFFGINFKFFIETIKTIKSNK